MSDRWSMASDVPAGILLNDTRTVLSRCLQQLDWQQCTANLKLDDSSTESGFQLDPMQHAFMFPYQLGASDHAAALTRFRAEISPVEPISGPDATLLDKRALLLPTLLHSNWEASQESADSKPEDKPLSESAINFQKLMSDLAARQAEASPLSEALTSLLVFLHSFPRVFVARTWPHAVLRDATARLVDIIIQNQDAAIDSTGCENASLAASALICLLAQSCSASVLWATVDVLLQWEHAQQGRQNASGQRIQLPLNWIGPAMCLIQALQSPLNISAPFPMLSVQSFNSPMSNSKGSHDNMTMTVSQCGSFLYVLSARGLEQLHTGYQAPSLSQLTTPSTVKMGSVIKCVPSVRAQEIGCQICCVGDRLYVWSSKLEWPLVEVLNANTLAVEGVLQLGIDAEFGAPHLNGRSASANVKLVTDGRLLYVLNIESVTVEEEKDATQLRKPKKKSSNDCVVVYVYDPTSRRADLEIPCYLEATERSRRLPLAEALCDSSNFVWSVPLCMSALRICRDDPNAAARYLLEHHDELRARERCPLVRRVVLPSATQMQNGSNQQQNASQRELTSEILVRCNVIATSHQLVICVPPHTDPWTSSGSHLIRAYSLSDNILVSNIMTQSDVAQTACYDCTQNLIWTADMRHDDRKYGVRSFENPGPAMNKQTTADSATSCWSIVPNTAFFALSQLDSITYSVPQVPASSPLPDGTPSFTRQGTSTTEGAMSLFGNLLDAAAEPSPVLQRDPSNAQAAAGDADMPPPAASVGRTASAQLRSLFNAFAEFDDDAREMMAAVADAHQSPVAADAAAADVAADVSMQASPIVESPVTPVLHNQSSSSQSAAQPSASPAPRAALLSELLSVTPQTPSVVIAEPEDKEKGGPVPQLCPSSPLQVAVFLLAHADRLTGLRNMLFESVRDVAGAALATAFAQALNMDTNNTENASGQLSRKARKKLLQSSKSAFGFATSGAPPCSDALVLSLQQSSDSSPTASWSNLVSSVPFAFEYEPLCMNALASLLRRSVDYFTHINESSNDAAYRQWSYLKSANKPDSGSSNSMSSTWISYALLVQLQSLKTHLDGLTGAYEFRFPSVIRDVESRVLLRDLLLQLGGALVNMLEQQSDEQARQFTFRLLNLSIECLHAGMMLFFDSAQQRIDLLLHMLSSSQDDLLYQALLRLQSRSSQSVPVSEFLDLSHSFDIVKIEQLVKSLFHHSALQSKSLDVEFDDRVVSDLDDLVSTIPPSLRMLHEITEFLISRLLNPGKTETQPLLQLLLLIIDKVFEQCGSLIDQIQLQESSIKVRLLTSEASPLRNSCFSLLSLVLPFLASMTKQHQLPKLVQLIPKAAQLLQQMRSCVTDVPIYQQINQPVGGTDKSARVLIVQSAHPYPIGSNSVNERICFTGAHSLLVSFDPRCATESSNDVLQISTDPSPACESQAAAKASYNFFGSANEFSSWPMHADLKNSRCSLKEGQRSVLIQGDGVILNFSARSQQLSNDNDDLPNGNVRQPTAARWGFRCAIRPLYPTSLPWLADHIHSCAELMSTWASTLISAPVALTLQLTDQSTDALCSTFQESFLALQGKPITSIQSVESALSGSITPAKVDSVQVLLAPLLNLGRLIHGHQTAVNSPNSDDLDETAYFFHGLNLLNAFVKHGAELSGTSDVKLDPEVAGVRALTYHIRSLTTTFFAFKSVERLSVEERSAWHASLRACIALLIKQNRLSRRLYRSFVVDQAVLHQSVQDMFGPSDSDGARERLRWLCDEGGLKQIVTDVCHTLQSWMLEQVQLLRKWNALCEQVQSLPQSVESGEQKAESNQQKTVSLDEFQREFPEHEQIVTLCRLKCVDVDASATTTARNLHQHFVSIASSPQTKSPYLEVAEFMSTGAVSLLEFCAPEHQAECERLSNDVVVDSDADEDDDFSDDELPVLSGKPLKLDTRGFSSNSAHQLSFSRTNTGNRLNQEHMSLSDLSSAAAVSALGLKRVLSKNVSSNSNGDSLRRTLSKWRSNSSAPVTSSKVVPVANDVSKSFINVIKTGGQLLTHAKLMSDVHCRAAKLRACGFAMASCLHTYSSPNRAFGSWFASLSSTHQSCSIYNNCVMAAPALQAEVRMQFRGFLASLISSLQSIPSSTAASMRAWSDLLSVKFTVAECQMITELDLPSVAVRLLRDCLSNSLPLKSMSFELPPVQGVLTRGFSLPEPEPEQGESDIVKLPPHAQPAKALAHVSSARGRGGQNRRRGSLIRSGSVRQSGRTEQHALNSVEKQWQTALWAGVALLSDNLSSIADAPVQQLLSPTMVPNKHQTPASNDLHSLDAMVDLFSDMITCSLSPNTSTTMSHLQRSSLLNDGLTRLMFVFWQRSLEQSSCKENLVQQLLRIVQCKNTPMTITPTVQRSAIRLLRRILPLLPATSCKSLALSQQLRDLPNWLLTAVGEQVLGQDELDEEAVGLGWRARVNIYEERQKIVERILAKRAELKSTEEKIAETTSASSSAVDEKVTVGLGEPCPLFGLVLHGSEQRDLELWVSAIEALQQWEKQQTSPPDAAADAISAQQMEVRNVAARQEFETRKTYLTSELESKGLLQARSGGIEILPDGHIINQSGFCSAVANISFNRGAWYYEVVLESDGLFQIGWATDRFQPDAAQGNGVGDDQESWAYDGNRLRAWHAGSIPFSDTAWRRGDVVGVGLDLERGCMDVFLNGEHLGTPFKFSRSDTQYRPALSVSQGQRALVVLERKLLKYLPLGDYYALVDDQPLLDFVPSPSKPSPRAVATRCLAELQNRGHSVVSVGTYEQCWLRARLLQSSLSSAAFTVMPVHAPSSIQYAARMAESDSLIPQIANVGRGSKNAAPATVILLPEAAAAVSAAVDLGSLNLSSIVPDLAALLSPSNSSLASLDIDSLGRNLSNLSVGQLLQQVQQLQLAARQRQQQQQQPPSTQSAAPVDQSIGSVKAQADAAALSSLRLTKGASVYLQSSERYEAIEHGQIMTGRAAHALASEFVSLCRCLLATPAWSSPMRTALTETLQSISPQNQDHAMPMYPVIGALSVLGGWSETLRAGGFAALRESPSAPPTAVLVIDLPHALSSQAHVIDIASTQNVDESQTLRVQTARAVHLQPLSEYVIDGVLFPLQASSINVLLGLITACVEQPKNQWLAAELGWRALAAFDALLPASLSASEDLFDGIDLKPIIALCQRLAQHCPSPSGIDRSSGSALASALTRADRLRARAWELRHLGTTHHLAAPLVRPAASVATTSTQQSQNAKIDVDVTYSCSPYCEENQSPSLDDNKMLKYWEKHIIPRVQEYVRGSFKEYEMLYFFETLRQPLRRGNGLEAQGIVFQLCANRVPDSVQFPPPDKDWSALTLEDVQVGQHLEVLNPSALGLAAAAAAANVSSRRGPGMAQATTNESPSPLVLQAQTRIGRVRAIEPNTESVLLQMVDEQSGVVVDYWVSVDLLRYPEVDGMQNGQAGAEDVVANGAEALSLLTARLSHVMQLYAGLALQRMLVVPVFRPLLIAAAPDESNRIVLPNSTAVEQDLINTWQWLQPALIENIDVSSVSTATLGQSIPTAATHVARLRRLLLQNARRAALSNFPISSVREHVCSAIVSLIGSLLNSASKFAVDHTQRRTSRPLTDKSQSGVALKLDVTGSDSIDNPLYCSRTVHIAGAASLLVMFSKASHLAPGAALGLYSDQFAVDLLRIYAGGQQGNNSLLPHVCGGPRVVLKLDYRGSDASSSDVVAFVIPVSPHLGLAIWLLDEVLPSVVGDEFDFVEESEDVVTPAMAVATQQRLLFEAVRHLIEATGLIELPVTPYKEALLDTVTRLLNRIMHLQCAEECNEDVLQRLTGLLPELRVLHTKESAGQFSSYTQQLLNCVLAADRLRPQHARQVSEFKFQHTVPADQANSEAPAEPVPEEVVNPVWACDVCTFENPEAAPVCDMCGSNKPPPRPKPVKRAPVVASAVAAVDVDESALALHDMLAVAELVRYLMGDVTLEECPAAQRLMAAALSDLRADVCSSKDALNRVLLVDNVPRTVVTEPNSVDNATALRRNVLSLLTAAQSDLRLVDSTPAFDMPVFMQWPNLTVDDFRAAAVGVSSNVPRQFTPSVEPMDQQGILYYLGTLNGARGWRNPSEAGSGVTSDSPPLVKVTAASVQADSKPATAICGREVVRCVSKPVENQWFALDFGANVRVAVTHYTLRHYLSWDTEALRSWVFQATNDNEPKESSWITLMAHSDDRALNLKGQAYTWTLPSNSVTAAAYCKFRVKMTGLNSNKHWYLSLSGIELYGQLYGNPFAVSASASSGAPTHTLLGLELAQSDAAMLSAAIKALDGVVVSSVSSQSSNPSDAVSGTSVVRASRASELLANKDSRVFGYLLSKLAMMPLMPAPVKVKVQSAVSTPMTPAQLELGRATSEGREMTPSPMLQAAIASQAAAAAQLPALGPAASNPAVASVDVQVANSVPAGVAAVTSPNVFGSMFDEPISVQLPPMPTPPLLPLRRRLPVLTAPFVSCLRSMFVELVCGPVDDVTLITDTELEQLRVGVDVASEWFELLCDEAEEPDDFDDQLDAEYNEDQEPTVPDESSLPSMPFHLLLPHVSMPFAVRLLSCEQDDDGLSWATVVQLMREECCRATHKPELSMRLWKWLGAHGFDTSLRRHVFIDDERNMALQHQWPRMTLTAEQDWMEALHAAGERCGQSDLIELKSSQLSFMLSDIEQRPSLRAHAAVLQNIPALRLRFAFLRRFNLLVASLLGLLDLRQATTDLQSTTALLMRAKHVLFRAVKMRFFHSVLDVTAVADAKRPTVSIDRLELLARRERGDYLDFGLFGSSAQKSTLSDVARNTKETTSTVPFLNHFGHAFQQLRNADKFALRPPRPHGTEPFYAFTVQFRNEHVVGEAGPWRQLFADISAELQTDDSPVLVHCPNYDAKVGDMRDKFTLRSGAANLPLCELLGMLMGCCLRTSVRLNLDLPPFVWKPLVGESLSRSDLQAIDAATVDTLKFLDSVDAATFDASFEETFSTLLSDKSHVDLLPDGSNIAVRHADRAAYINLIEQARLHEHAPQIAALRRGIGYVVPTQVLSLFTWYELEMLVCGKPEIDIELLKRHTQYSGVRAEEPHIGYFWSVLESFSQDLRRQFVRFAWAQERLPADDDEFRHTHTRMLIKASVGGGPPDSRFPKADTCFFNLELPQFSSETVMREKLVYAMQTTTMNADEEQLQQ